MDILTSYSIPEIELEHECDPKPQLDALESGARCGALPAMLLRR